MMRYIRFALLMALILALHGASAATAIEFQLLDRSSDATTSPQPGQSLPECLSTAFNTQGGNLTPSEVLLDTSSHALIRGTNCNHSASANAQQSLLVSLIGAPGATTQICYVTRFTAATPAEGADVTASADVGGNPYTDPGGIYLNGVPISEIQRHFDVNQEDSATARGLFTATVGDQIRLATGSNGTAGVVGVGSARGEASMFAAIYIGECPRERAPAASPIGLGGLAVALAALGALMLRWRQRRAR